MTRSAPRLSVIIASTLPAQEVPTCLAAVVPHCRDPRVEIILTYAAERDLPPTMVAGSAGIVFLRLPQTASLPQLLGAALTRAQGEIIAITDATCALDEHWVPAILQAHTAPHPVIGGVVEPAGLCSLVDWAAYFYDYGRFMWPLAAGVARLVPGINISLKRWALATGSEFVQGEFWKGQWCWHLQAAGISLYLEPDIVVFYRKSFTFWSFLCRWFQHGQCFAGMRLAQLSGMERFLYLVGSPLLPVVFCWRFLKDVLPKRRHVRQLVLSFPLIVLAMLSWALGEFVGYLSGPGVSCQQVR
jgi:hypothetical protein